MLMQKTTTIIVQKNSSMARIKTYISTGLLIVAFIFVYSETDAQALGTMQQQQDKPTEIDSFLLELPSLETLIDSALARAPELRVQTAEEKLRMHQIDVARKSWSKNIITGNANYNYGDNLILGDNAASSQLNSNYEASSHYSVGVSMRIPISSLFDHQELNTARIEMEKAQAERFLVVREVREEVNIRYLSLLNAYSRYKILLDDQESHEIALQNAQKDFLSGRISLEQVTGYQSANAKSKIDVAEAKNQFESAIWRMEEITGFRLSH